MIITIDKLKKGDEVLVSGHDIRYLKLLRDPQKRTKPNSWGNTDGYKTIKCLEQYDKVGGISAHNREVYYDFNYGNIWLIKEEDHGN